MEIGRIKRLLGEVRSGRIGAEEALQRLQTLPFEDLGFAKIDTHRSLRRGFPEVILCEGKTTSEVQDITRSLLKQNNVILATRAAEEVCTALREISDQVEYHREARIVVVGTRPQPHSEKAILVVSVGHDEIPVAEEAAVTAETMGNRVNRLYDVGIAAAYRIRQNPSTLNSSSVVIVVTAREGGIPGFFGALAKKPVIAVPVSLPSRDNFEGLTPLLSALTTTVPGVLVVNIDNGFGAGYAASLINGLRREDR